MKVRVNEILKCLIVVLALSASGCLREEIEALKAALKNNGGIIISEPPAPPVIKTITANFNRVYNVRKESAYVSDCPSIYGVGDGTAVGSPGIGYCSPIARLVTTYHLDGTRRLLGDPEESIEVIISGLEVACAQKASQAMLDNDRLMIVGEALREVFPAMGMPTVQGLATVIQFSKVISCEIVR
ncbi:MAG: hypothetical protein AABZ55_05870 [Bdellovibrionota bacterium]